MSSSSDLVRIVESVLGVSLEGSVSDSVIVIVTTSLAVVVGLLVFVWRKSAANRSRDARPVVVPHPPSLRDDGGDEDVAASGKKKVTIFFGTQTGTAEGFAKVSTLEFRV